MAMVTFIRVTGKMTKPMAKEYTCIKMDRVTLDSGIKIFSMDLEYRNGWMDHLMKGIWVLI